MHVVDQSEKKYWFQINLEMHMGSRSVRKKAQILERVQFLYEHMKGCSF